VSSAKKLMNTVAIAIIPKSSWDIRRANIIETIIPMTKPAYFAKAVYAIPE
jgi:hypothetical protein